MTSPEPDCTAVEEQLSAFLDGELTSGAAAGALEHAFSCASCRAFFVAARRLQALAPELAEPPAAGAAPDGRRRNRRDCAPTCSPSRAT